MATDQHLLRCCAPQCTQHATNPKNHATSRATGAQQPSLKALALLAIERNNPRNSHTTAAPETAQQTPVFDDPFVAQFSDLTGDYGTGRDGRGRTLPALVACGDCEHFRRNTMNPEAGIGTCQHGEPDQGRLPYYPAAVRVCKSFEGK